MGVGGDHARAGGGSWSARAHDGAPEELLVDTCWLLLKSVSRAAHAPPTIGDK